MDNKFSEIKMSTIRMCNKCGYETLILEDSGWEKVCSSRERENCGGLMEIIYKNEA